MVAFHDMNHSMSVIFPFCSHSPLILSMLLMICLHCQSQGWISHDLPQDIPNSSRWFPMKYSFQSPFSLGKSHEITIFIGIYPMKSPIFPCGFHPHLDGPVPAISIAGPALVPAVNGGLQFHRAFLRRSSMARFRFFSTFFHGKTRSFTEKIISELC